jgi:hypothetical protein
VIVTSYNHHRRLLPTDSFGPPNRSLLGYERSLRSYPINPRFVRVGSDVRSGGLQTGAQAAGELPRLISLGGRSFSSDIKPLNIPCHPDRSRPLFPPRGLCARGLRSGGTLAKAAPQRNSNEHPQPDHPALPPLRPANALLRKPPPQNPPLPTKSRHSDSPDRVVPNYCRANLWKLL